MKKCSRNLSLLFIALGYTLVLSQCSPLFGKTPTGDYEIFYLIGRMWSEGYVPYVDMFDHKGPIIFFIYRAGIFIGSRYGVFFLQTLALWLVLCITFKMNTGKEKGKDWNTDGLLSILLILGYLPFVEFQYPLTETFCLPFIMLSALGICSYFNAYAQKRTHSAGWAFIYGMTFAVCFYTRVTNAITVCVWVLSIAVLLAAEKQWKNLRNNILAFLFGTSVILIPFAVYFAYHGAFFDMLNGTILFNIENTIGITSQIQASGLLRRIVRTSPAWICIVLCIITRSADRRVRIIHGIAAVCSIMIVSLSYAFGHYSIILSVFIPIDLQLLIILCRSRDIEIQKVKKILLVLAILILFSVSLIVYRRSRIPDSKETAFAAASREIASYIPEDEKDQVIGFDVDSNFYLYTDIRPCYKYFTFQSKQMRYSERMKKENIEFYWSGAAKWVVVDGWILNAEIQEAIDENYQIEKAYQWAEGGDLRTLYLYKRST